MEVLGRYLRLGEPTLEIIGCKFHGYPKECLTQTLLAWLRRQYNVERYHPPSWTSLCNAIKSPIGGNNPALAEEIAKKYNIEIYSFTVSMWCILLGYAWIYLCQGTMHNINDFATITSLFVFSSPECICYISVYYFYYVNFIYIKTVHKNIVFELLYFSFLIIV